MNEKYLWDKTGEDKEIEKLENALKSLRYRETAPPFVQMKAATAKKTLLKLWPLAIPAMACLLIALLVPLMFEDAGKQNPEIAQETRPQKSVQVIDETVDSKPTTLSPQQTVKFEEKPPRKRLNKLPKTRPPFVKLNTVIARKRKESNPVDVLTKEERYAYDQLITALAITSSQFRLVRDKIHGVENQSVEVKDLK